ncbi:DUF2812 domain-containing protein, partial [Clostridium botulinum]|nr:DUF2812 domain-containing protein [Clostridium botulinum]
MTINSIFIYNAFSTIKIKKYISTFYYHQLDNDSDKKEYIQLLKDAGWNFISQYDNMIFLRA